MNRRRVLIETSWNVKEEEMIDSDVALLSINRNIVECKDMKWAINELGLMVLIETSWNVK